MRLFANIISIIFHPLLMVTYGVILALSYTYLSIYPANIKQFLLMGVFLTTAVIPGAFIFLLVRTGGASDLELTNRKERLIPYLIIILSNITCLFLMFRMKVPDWLIDLIMGVCVALIISFCINFFWKISAHALGIGGLLGAVMGMSEMYRLNPYPLFIALIIAAGLVGTSRIILKKHTPLQVYAGFTLGLVTTYLFSIKVILYYIFIK
ncbi:MAG: phosphatase PAP2 family protein [Tannerellaceae bacterium]|nr:phosphatase PAP2 family protein [Tannerellaceae bacterium]